jgi:uncharacterized protein YkwD
VPRLAWICVLLLSLPAFADDLDARGIVNQLRAGGCAANKILPALKTDVRLQNAAQTLVTTRGSAKLAARNAGYAASQISSIHLSGNISSRDMRMVLKQNYCPMLLDAWQHISSATRGAELWIVLATPQPIPTDAQQTAREVLQLVNQARAQPRRCGKQQLPATTPLQLNALLMAAAQTHADDMARKRFLDHTGSNGSTPATRVTRQGYRHQLVGENIAAGPGSAAEVVSGWLTSPGHCANIMNAGFKQMGVAFAVNPQDDYGVYWSQVFATQR